MKNRTTENDEGNALLIVIGIIGLLSIIGTILLSVSRASVEQTTVTRATVQARATAESGLDYLAAMLAEKRGHDGIVQTDLVAACNSWLSNPSSLTREVGPSSDPDGTFTVTIQTASDSDGPWSDNCSGGYLRLISTGVATDKGVGTKRGSTARMMSTFELPTTGTPGTPGSNLPGADLWDFSGNDEVIRSDANNTVFNANMPNLFQDELTGGTWVRIISDTNGNSTFGSKSFWQNGYMLLKQPFDTSKDLTVDFDYRIYNQLETKINFSGDMHGEDIGVGDGFSFFFVDHANPPEGPGAFGAGLGYAPAANQGGLFSPYTAGIKGGYLGIGIDAYGNYQKAEPSNTGGACNWGDLNHLVSTPIPGGATRSSTIFNCLTGNSSIRAGNPDAGQMEQLKPNSISIRGAGNSTYVGDTPWTQEDWKKAYGFSDDLKQGGYRWLKGSRANLDGIDGVKGLVYNETSDGERSEKYRHVRFIMEKKENANQHDIELWLSRTIFSKNNKYSESTYDQTGSDKHWIKFDIKHIEENSQDKNGYIPSEIRYGIAASSGWASATIEIGNLALESDGEIVEPLKGTEGALGTFLSKNDLLN